MNMPLGFSHPTHRFARTWNWTTTTRPSTQLLKRSTRISCRKSPIATNKVIASSLPSSEQKNDKSVAIIHIHVGRATFFYPYVDWTHLTLFGAYCRHTSDFRIDVIYMAHGISLFKRYQNTRSQPSDEIQHFLNSFNRGRLGIRIMVGHHLALQNQLFYPSGELSSSSYLSTPTSAQSKRVGIIEPQCDIEALIQNATHSAQFVFFQHYSTVFPPNVHIVHAKELGGKKVRFPVVPALLHHILFELLKNSMRATAEFHGLDRSSYPGEWSFSRNRWK